MHLYMIPYWSVQSIVIVWIAFYYSEFRTGSLLLCLVITYWGIRFTANWAYTFHGMDHMDWRYSMLREKTGSLYPLVNLCGIQLIPTLIVWSCVLPAVYYKKKGMGK